MLDRMFVLLPLQATTNYSVRGLLPQLIQDIVVIQAFNEAQQSTLLSAFYPGYILAMLPAGWAVQKFGPKALLGLDNYLQGLALLLLPACAKLGVLPLCACMATVGIAQAPIFPGQSVMKRDFQGSLQPSLRPWAIQFMRLSAAGGEVFSKYTTPIISLRFGWQAVCYSYGGVSLVFAILWGLFAKSKPVAKLAPKPHAELGPGMEESKLEYGVLRVPAAMACMAAHASCNNLGYTVSQFAPSFYASVLRCDTLTTGAHLAVTALVRFVGNFMGASLETGLQRAGVKQITIRRVVCLTINSIQGLCCLGFGLARTPRFATLMNCGVCLCDSFQGIGFSQNYYEVGGPDTAILTSVGNVFASVGGMAAPPLGLYLMRRFNGQWYPVFLVAAIIHWFAGISFFCLASDIPARQLLYNSRRRKQERAKGC